MTQPTRAVVSGTAAPEVVGVLWEAAAQDFRFTFVGESAERAFGYPARWWLDDPEFWTAIVHPDDRDRVVAVMREATRTAGGHTLDYRIIAGDGRPLWIRNVFRVGAGAGGAARIWGVMIDATSLMGAGRREAEQIEAERGAPGLAEQEAGEVLRLRAEDRVLTAIASATAGEPHIDRILSITLDHLREIISFTGGSVALVEGDDLVVRAAAGPFAGEALWQRLPRGRGRLWGVVETGRPFLSHDLRAEGLAPTTPINSYLAVPLIWRGRAFGTLEVDSTQSHAFKEGDQVLLERVARVLSGAIELAVRYGRETEALARVESLARHLARLQAVTAGLSGALTPAQIAEVIVDQGISAAGAQAGSLSITRDGGKTLELVRAVGYPDDFTTEWAKVPTELRPAAAEALRRGTPIFFSDAEAMRAALYRPVTGAYGILPYPGARALVPLRGPRGTLGVLSFAFPGARGFSDEDRAFIGTLGDQCAQALDRAAQYEREHHVAETLQRALLPQNLPELPGLALRAAYRPGGQLEVGGDWYDGFVLPDGGVAVVIGDVVGRGLDAAVVMGQVRQAIRAVALSGEGPATILEQAGTLLSLTHGGEGMATAVVGIIDQDAASFTYASAGHPPPVLASAGGRIQRLTEGGPPLGVLAPAAYRESTMPLPLGGLVVLYTDGLIESTRDAVAAEDTLLRAIAAETAEPSADRAGAILARAAAAHPLVDDLAVVTVSVAPDFLERFDVALPSEPTAPARVRPALRRVARHAGLDEDLTMALLVAAGEAMSNAVLHAYTDQHGTIQVRAWGEGRAVTVEVEDYGRWRESRRDRGRGLAVMRRLVDDCRIQSGPAGTIVRLTVNTPSRAVGAART
ncbi:MAG TPA: SpoIIE family protein phosphatase [bacterium]|nr:SpoIIE family protein phosphatase [bacterium]